MNQSLDTKITFLSYWFLKRNIPEVSISVILRDKMVMSYFFLVK